MTLFTIHTRRVISSLVVDGAAFAAALANEELIAAVQNSGTADGDSFYAALNLGSCHNRLAGRFASQEVYIAMHLNGDIASGRPGAISYRADFRLERIDLPNLR